MTGTTLERHAHATAKTAAHLRDRPRVTFSGPEDGWWKIVLDVPHPADPDERLCATATRPDEVMAHQAAMHELRARIFAYFSDPDLGRVALARDRDQHTFDAAFGLSIRRLDKALRARGAPTSRLPVPLGTILATSEQLRADRITVGMVADALMVNTLQRPARSGGQGTLLA